MRCPTSHLESDGQLVDMFPPSSSANTFNIVSTEIFPGHHVVFDDCVLKCPTCHVVVARPYDPRNLPPSSLGDVSADEIALNLRHQRVRSR